MSNQYRKDPFWARKKLTPGQVQINDVSFGEGNTLREARLAIDEVQISSLIPEEGFGNSEKLKDKWSKTLNDITNVKFSLRTEEQNILQLQHDYGWMSELRLLDTNTDNVECRWIHVSNKFRRNLSGILVGMSVWSKNAREIVEALRQIDILTQDQERFSKHGRMFAPFIQPLTSTSTYPVLMSVPFLDWTVHPDEDTPPLRFQVDELDMYYSTQIAAHPVRSLLQHYYRLEDTSERERNQVFARHRPWYTNRHLDLKVRRWYGHYPAGLLVDELWVLAIDEHHIVTFSSNQSWKSRWPPMQVSSRIFELSVRDLRDRFSMINNAVTYSSLFHAIACLHGAIGLMHRSFWTDMPMPLTERYGGYLSHLQYRIYRTPSTKLVMELLQAQDELNIIQDITQQQLELLADLRTFIQEINFQHPAVDDDPASTTASRQSTLVLSPIPTITQFDPSFRRVRSRSPASAPSSARTALAQDCLNSVISKLTREQGDITSLKTSANDLLTRTIQLVNIRTESHNQAILVFTVITVIFLPLSFMASFFGMNTSDIRNLEAHQGLFWACALSLTAGVVLLSIIIAFYGAKIGEAFSDLKAGNVPHENQWLTRIPIIGSSSTETISNVRPRKKVRKQHVTSNDITLLDSFKAESMTIN